MAFFVCRSVTGRQLTRGQVVNLTQLGWCEQFERSYRKIGDGSICPARITRRNRNAYQVHGEHGPLRAQLAGRFLHESGTGEALPAVGDWVVVEELLDEKKATIHALLPSKSRFSRKAVGVGGRTGQRGEWRRQVVAANVDIAFLVSSLDGGRNFNLTRLERYLTLAWESGATPVVVLNKADLCNNPEEFVVAVEAMAFGVTIHQVSAVSGEGVGGLAAHLPEGRTGVFLGPSGVGKSSLINTLLGADQLATQEGREGDRRGRHTTTWSEILFLPGRGMVIDTPGMRDVQIWANEESLGQTFADIKELAQMCQFRNCVHDREDGCAVLAALEAGSLGRKHYEGYLKQRREVEYVARQADSSEARAHKGKERKLSKLYRKYKQKN